MDARTGTVLALLLASPIVARASKLPDTFEGYVTSVASQDRFEMSSRRVEANAKTQRVMTVRNDSEGGAYAIPSIRVGSLLQIEGHINKQTKEFTANSISYLPQPEWGGKPGDKIEDIGLIEETPALQREGNGAAGELWVNGYPLKVTPRTKFLGEDGKDISLGRIRTNLWASFQGKWLPDHSIEALTIRFAPNTISQDEMKYRDGSEPEVELPDYANHKPGKIKWGVDWTLNIRWTLKILPDRAIQDYVTRVGESLVPQYQRDLPTSNPSKINFRFYVVERPSRWKETLNDASASPGGIVVVPDNVLASLDNEAQLAALLSNCIAGILGKQGYRHHTRTKTQNVVGLASDFAGLYGLPVGVGNSIASNRLALQINERDSRIGLRYMLHAGYDLREAPFAWTVAANKKVKNPWPVKADPSDLTQSLMSDLYFDYASTHYSQLETNREAYRKMLTELRSVAPKLPKSKNHPE